MQENPAILEALHVFKQPVRARSIHRRALPPGMLTVIKIAAGDQATIDDWSTACGESTLVIKQAASFFLQQSIAKAGQDRYRTLGLTPQATKEDIRKHKRWLLKWLHPDRNPSKWESALFHRVSVIAQSLEANSDDGTASVDASNQQNYQERKYRQNHLLPANPKKPTIVRRFSLRAILFRVWKRIACVLVLFVAAGLFAYLVGDVDMERLLVFGR
jgi:DnaJ domain